MQSLRLLLNSKVIKLTGEKNIFQTFEKMNKLEDKDLRTPEHDELVLELLNPVNYMKFLKCIGYNPEWKIIGHNTKYDMPDDIDRNYAISALNNNLRLKLGEWRKLIKDKYKITTRTEVPVVTGNNNFIIGYVDVEFKLPFKYKHTIHSDSIRVTEYSVRASGKLEYTNESFSDIYPFLDTSIREGEVLYKTIKVEVKPYIQSFGETMRQLNTYRLHSMIFKDIDGDGGKQYSTAEFVIFSPDTRFKAAFESQGIKFVSPMDCLTPNFNSLWLKRVPQEPEANSVWDDSSDNDKSVVKKEIVIPDDWW